VACNNAGNPTDLSQSVSKWWLFSTVSATLVADWQTFTASSQLACTRPGLFNFQSKGSPQFFKRSGIIQQIFWEWKVKEIRVFTVVILLSRPLQKDDNSDLLVTTTPVDLAEKQQMCKCTQMSQSAVINQPWLKSTQLSPGLRTARHQVFATPPKLLKATRFSG